MGRMICILTLLVNVTFVTVMVTGSFGVNRPLVGHNTTFKPFSIIDPIADAGCW